MNLAAVLLTAAALSASAADPAYRLEDVPLPAGASPEISAVAFTPSGNLVIANRHGEVWMGELPGPRWRRFAHGLNEPMGLVADSDSVVYVSHKPELTRLVDTDRDGSADSYETVNAHWPHSDNWHEHAFGLRRDSSGNLIMALGQVDTAGPVNVRFPRVPLDPSSLLAEKKHSMGPGQGWLFKIAPDGATIPWAYGFREACGVGLSPDGEIFVTDQQGDYIPSSALLHVERDRFYGHPSSAKWAPRFAGKKPTLQELAAARVSQTVILPHGSVGGSPGEPVWDTTGGKFGPFTGQVFIGDFTKLISRVDLQKVNGEYQGACFWFLRDAVGADGIAGSSGKNNLTIPAGGDGKKYFRDAPALRGTPLRQGNMRMAFAPDASLYIAQTTRGWGVGDGLQRLTWTGQAPVEIHTMRLTPRGFRLRFTVPMDSAALADARSYRLSRFRYLYHGHYGSPRVDPADIAVTQVIPSAPGDEVELVLASLEPGYVHELEISHLRSADGRELVNNMAWYTLNQTLDGRRFTGPLTRPIHEAPRAAKLRAPDIANGQKLYGMFCVQCHQPDGRGGSGLPGLPGIAAANFAALDSPLVKKPDDQLRQSIAQGIPLKGMPPFAQVISPQDIADVLGFVRATFQHKPVK